MREEQEQELEKLAAALRQIPPSAPPEELMMRLRAATAGSKPAKRPAPVRMFHWLDWFTGWRRWAVMTPAMATAVLILLWLELPPTVQPDKTSPLLSDKSGIKANAVQVDHSLMASFDTVAQMPGGESVRFRCRAWQDEVVIRDDAHGVVISKSTPRVEVIPVSFETY